MSTLVIRSNMVISNPAYGALVDIDSGLRFALDARDINVANGASVTKWEASKGIGDVNEKVFDNKHTDYNYPTFVTSSTLGLPSVKFDGTSVIFNNNNDAYFTNSATYAFIAKVNVLNPTVTGVSRIFSGDAEDDVTSLGDSGLSDMQRHEVYPHNGRIYMRMGKEEIGGGEELSSPIVINSDWHVFVMVFDGGNSKSLVSKKLSSSSDIVSQNFNNRSYNDRIFIGATANELISHQNTAFNGEIAYMSQYDRALSDSDMVGLANHLAGEFNIA